MHDGIMEDACGSPAFIRKCNGRMGTRVVRDKAMARGANKLSLKNVDRIYGSFTALQPCTLDVADGEFLVILGPSGSGKSTLLKLIAGFDSPSGGSISLDGTDVTMAPAYSRNVGMVFQNYALFPHLSVFRNVAFPLEVRGHDRRRIAESVTKMLRLVGLEGFGERKIQSLSGGQQQRVALARGLVFEPTLLLLDEPLSALDKQLRELMQEELRRIHAEVGTTFIGVTHDQREALIMADRIVVMRDGRIEQIDTPANLYFRPANRFVADFVGVATLWDGVLLDLAASGSRVLGTVRVADDLTVRALAHGQPPPVKGPATIMVRPEKIRVSTDATPVGQAAEINRMWGVVRDAKFSGEFVELAVAVRDDLLLKAKMVPRPDHRAGDYVVGSKVFLEWDSADTAILPVADHE